MSISINSKTTSLEGIFGISKERAEFLSEKHGAARPAAAELHTREVMTRQAAINPEIIIILATAAACEYCESEQEKAYLWFLYGHACGITQVRLGPVMDIALPFLEKAIKNRKPEHPEAAPDTDGPHYDGTAPKA